MFIILVCFFCNAFKVIYKVTYKSVKTAKKKPAKIKPNKRTLNQVATASVSSRV